MDQERTLLVVAVGVAFAVGCFVLWGPSTFRSKRRKGQVVGLVNLGKTCFLNTLLQALASCPTVIDWLLNHKHLNDGSLAASLRTILLILNGEHDCVSDPYAPVDVITALVNHNWIIPQGEQDAHELFHVILQTLEEEISSTSSKKGSLADILPSARCGQGDDFYRQSNGIEELFPNENLKSDGDQHLPTPASKCLPGRLLKENYVLSYVSQRTDRQPFYQDLNPFLGMTTSQLKCTQCSCKTSLRFDKFDTLSLPLPPSTRGQHLTLQMLLDNFVKTEIVKGVTCANCSRGKEKSVQTTALKTLNFGKLPKCLCLHLMRTTWTDDGTPWKRNDAIDFPEFLIMDNYTHSQVERSERQLLKAVVSDNKMKTAQEPDVMEINGNSTSQESLQQRKITSSNAKHMYRLKAVVVHNGDMNSGHFITYRKGPVKSLIRHRLLNVETNMGHPESRESARWFYTSDMVVRKATLCDALLSNAYMLFYERCVLPEKTSCS